MRGDCCLWPPKCCATPGTPPPPPAVPGDCCVSPPHGTWGHPRRWQLQSREPCRRAHGQRGVRISTPGRVIMRRAAGLELQSCVGASRSRMPHASATPATCKPPPLNALVEARKGSPQPTSWGACATVHGVHVVHVQLQCMVAPAMAAAVAAPLHPIGHLGVALPEDLALPPLLLRPHCPARRRARRQAARAVEWVAGTDGAGSQWW